VAKPRPIVLLSGPLIGVSLWDEVVAGLPVTAARWANDGSCAPRARPGCPDSLRRYCPAALNATICITQLPPPVTGADALYEPAAVTVRSSAMSPSGTVMMRLV